jgi:hypothetical protein
LELDKPGFRSSHPFLGRSQLEDLGVYGKITLKGMLKTNNGCALD